MKNTAKMTREELIQDNRGLRGMIAGLQTQLKQALEKVARLEDKTDSRDAALDKQGLMEIDKNRI